MILSSIPLVIRSFSSAPTMRSLRSGFTGLSSSISSTVSLYVMIPVSLLSALMYTGTALFMYNSFDPSVRSMVLGGVLT